MKSSYFDDIRFLNAAEVLDCRVRIDQSFPPSLALNFMHSGSISFQVGEGPVTQVQAPMGFWIHGGVQHRYSTTPGSRPWNLLWVMATGPRVWRMVRKGLAPASDRPVGMAPDPESFRQGMQELVDRVRRGRSEDQARRVILFESLLAQLRPWSGESSERRPLDWRRDEAIEGLANAISSEPTASYNFENWASRHGLSYHHLRRLFAQKIGRSPQAYVIDCRMRWAAARLAEGNLSVKEIADRVGLENAFYFSRCFRQRMGFAPSRLKPSRFSRAPID
ncbi:HTH-type transcriptional activator Btr [mine drainage metagenome]|uniref:HTH-type transcriptional activator Btr n=1 Tax=mine drainage metagenome TaxID=410659 RepID=A0A1J5R290_9ZZZZ